MTQDPTVFIVDDDDEVRAAICLLMESVGLKGVGYDSAQAFLGDYEPGRPGCLVLDVRMREMSGLELQQRLSSDAFSPPIVIVTGHGNVPMAVRAVQAGAIDFLEKPFNDQALLDAVDRAITVDARRRNKALQERAVQQRLDQLTPRERDVLEQILAGKRNKVIAADLGISQSTVEAHRAKIMDKLGARSVSELLRLTLPLHEISATGEVKAR